MLETDRTNVLISLTPRARAMLTELQQEHGSQLTFIISGGCCDATSPMLLKDFRLGAQDRKLGEVEGVGVYATAEQATRLAGYRLEIDLIEGGWGNSFSLEIARRARFIVRTSRLPA